MSQSDADYVSFDEREDVLASSALLELVAPQLKERPFYWKWMIIGAESALQGAMVCALSDSTGTSILDKESAGKLSSWLNDKTDNRGNPPAEWLATFPSLLDKCVSELGLVLSGDQRKDIERLHDNLRNNFVHFTPKGWSIEKAGLPRIIETALDALTHLMNSHRPGVILDGEQKQRLEVSLAHIKRALKVEKSQP